MGAAPEREISSPTAGRWDPRSRLKGRARGSSQEAGTVRTRSKRLRHEVSARRTGMLFVAPVVVLVGLVVFLPLIQAVYYSFTDWNGQTAQYVGLENYKANLISGPSSGRILLNNAIILAAVPLIIALALVVALALRQGYRGSTAFRTVYFIPTALSPVAVGLVATALFSGGELSVGNWLAGSWSALAAVLLAFAWCAFGANAIILLAGLSSIDPQVLEAARLDGAGPVRRVVYIILPLLKRFLAVSFFITLVAALTGMFGLIYTMTHGGPGYSTTTLEFSIYTNAFSNGSFGLAASAGVILLIVTIAVTWPRVCSGAKSS